MTGVILEEEGTQMSPIARVTQIKMVSSASGWPCQDPTARTKLGRTHPQTFREYSHVVGTFTEVSGRL